MNQPIVVFVPPPELGAPAANLKQYEITFRRNSAISEALRVLKNAIISSLPDADKNELSDPFFGLVSISCQQLLDHLRERYGTFLASDFDSFRTNLNTKIGSRTFSELAAQHRLIHVQFLSANQGLSEVDKCRYLRAAIASHMSYTTAITHCAADVYWTCQSYHRAGAQFYTSPRRPRIRSVSVGRYRYANGVPRVGGFRSIYR